MTPPGNPAPAIFAAKDPMAALMLAFDWPSTSLGEPETWPQSLRSALSICLNSRYPICICWGPEHILLYNGAYSAILGDKHPWALGRTAREVWPEIWDIIGPRFAKVIDEGEAICSEEELLPMRRCGYTEECYFNFNISPVMGEGDAVVGIFNAVIETTGRVILERRTKLLRKLAEGMAGALSAHDVCSRTAALLGSGAEDVPFCLIYTPNWEKGGREAKLYAAAGIEAGGPRSPGIIPLDNEGTPERFWPLKRAAQSGRLEIVEDLSAESGAAFPGGAWPESARSAAVIPIHLSTGLAAKNEIPDAFLILGINPRQTFDGHYRSFAQAAADSFRDAFKRGRAYDEEKRRTDENWAIVNFALNRVREAAFLIDNDARFLYVNDGAIRSLGYSREELLHMRVPDIDPDYPPERWARYLEEIEVVRSATFETRHRSKDGRIFPVEINAHYFEYNGKHYSTALVRDISERKRAEEEQRRAAEQRIMLECAMDRVHEGAFLIGNDGRFLYVNGGAARFLGYSREELLGMTVRDIDPDFPPIPWESYLREHSNEDSRTFETRHKTKDGRIFPVEITSGRFRHDGIDYRMSLVRDISERKGAEEERRRAAEQRVMLEFSMDRVHEGAFLFGNDGRFLYVNAEAARSLGYSREELLRLSVPEIDPDCPAERFAAHIRDVSAAGSVTIETRHRTKDGRIFPVEIYANYFEYEGNAYIMALSRDISERKRAEEERRRAAEQRVMLEFAMDRVHEGAFLIDNRGRFLYVNAEASRALGYSREDLLCMGVPDIDPDFRQERWNRDICGAPRSGTFETRHRSKDGRIYPVEIKSNFFQYEGKNYSLALVSDISGRKQQEAQRLAHLRFIECMDQVNRAIQSSADLEQMMESVLDAVLSAFDCDRAWLTYPADPDAPTWGVPMERTRPEYPGAYALQLEFPMGPEFAAACRMMLAKNGPMMFGAAYQHHFSEVQRQHHINSQISMAIYPKVGKPWVFGLHQCSYRRIWTPEEELLFQEIGRRISDALTSLLAHRDLRKNEEKYREIFDNVSDSLILCDVASDGRLVLADMNPCAERIMGVSKSEAVGRLFEDTVSQEMAARSLPLFRQCLETGEPVTYDEDVKLAPGARSLHTTLLPVRNESGAIYRLIVFNRDITERKAYEKHLHMLMREVNHRAKNLLAVVQAVVRQMAGDENPKLFEKRLSERISALAASHDLLVKNEWRGVDMDMLVTAQLAHFKDLIGSRVILKGPPALLKPEASQALGMALHELATNAGKYGALSGEKGLVWVEWDFSTNGRAPFFRVRWSECDGPPPAPPEREGFGQKVMVQMAEYALDAKVSLSYPSSGLVWELTAPAARATEAAPLAPALFAAAP